jgi:hypothetical protein
MDKVGGDACQDNPVVLNSKIMAALFSTIPQITGLVPGECILFFCTSTDYNY